MGSLTVGDVAGRLVAWCDRLMPPDERRDALIATLRAGFGGDDRPATAERLAEVERLAWTVSRHVALFPDPPATEPHPPGDEPDPARTEADPAGEEAPTADEPAWPPPDPDDVRRRAANVTRVERLPDGTGLLRIDGLDAVGLAQPYVDAAFGLLRGAGRIVLDLRRNGGGDPGTVALIAGWLLGDASVKLSDVVYRDRVRQWWTPERPPGTALRQDVDVLVGPGTFSSGEALAYHLRSRGRVRVIGEATPGAADHVLPVRLAPTVLAHVPNARVVDAVSGGNWEGTGVPPDLPCPADEALDRALG
ncbi:S41 family peptidase [Virgisporangium aliadipatigenens]|nr:S41 family peptidase [Virgisporangium aliadipatigenens]